MNHTENLYVSFLAVIFGASVAYAVLRLGIAAGWW